MRKLLCILLSLALMIPVFPLAENYPLSITAPDSTIRPGKAFLLTFSVPEDDEIDLFLTDAQGNKLMDVLTGYPASAGTNHVWWNGTSGGMSPTAGVWQLMLHTAHGNTACTVVVGAYAPYLTSIVPVKDAETKTMTVDFYASVSGLLTVGVWNGGAWALLENRDIDAGMNQIVWDANQMKQNTTAVTLTLTDATGFSSNEEHIRVAAEDFGIVFETPTPSPTATPEATATPTPAITPIVEESEATATVEPMEDFSFTDDLEIDLEDAQAAAETPTPAPTATPALSVQAFTPSYGSAYPLTEADEGTYWGTPMDVTDEEAMWTMLTSPFVYYNASYKGQKKVYAEPDDNSRAVAVITGESQGVRVIENRDDGWSLIELYSSTFHDNSIDAWNMLVSGYVRTSNLKTRSLDDKKYHIVVDKLTQRLYLFGEGKLISTLLVSTGLSNEKQPYNETRSGDFRYISATGGFWSDNMFCPRAMKFNDGDLLHEVPYVQRSGGRKVYSTTEPYLGQRASHGCIRVQRNKTPEGINMEWIWDHRKEIGRIVIWEDWQGRQIAYPAEDSLLYYNPNGGSYYHRAETCNSAKDHIEFTPFTYAELDTGDFAKLEHCPYCVPALRKAEIDQINLLHAPGGDHDPVLTKCRNKYLQQIVDKHGLDALTPDEMRYYTPDE